MLEAEAIPPSPTTTTTTTTTSTLVIYGSLTETPRERRTRRGQRKKSRGIHTASKVKLIGSTDAPTDYMYDLSYTMSDQ